MNPQKQLRKVLDQANKLRAKLPATGGDLRLGQEAANTSAIARSQALLRYKNAKLK